MIIVATTREDVIRALYRHIGECEQCGGKGVPVPNAFKCATGKRLAQVFTVR